MSKIIAQYFHYEIKEVRPLSALEDFKEHRRLKVFHQKGCKCVQCGIEGKILALGEGRGQLHWDIYTEDFYPLTINHIVPKSFGGSDDPENLQPMCCLCNWAKGNGTRPIKCNRTKYPVSIETPKETRNFVKINKIEIGKSVYRKVSIRKNKYVLLGTISKSCINPFTGHASVMVKEKPDSFFHLKNLYYERI